MHHVFHYGFHSTGTSLTPHDASRLFSLGHTAHLRFIPHALKLHQLHQERTALHALRHYGLYVIVDISNNKDVRSISQQLRGFADSIILPGELHQFIVEHDTDEEDDAARAHRIRSALRSIEAAQAQGEDIRGYFAGSLHPEIRQSDIVFRAIIEQAKM